MTENICGVEKRDGSGDPCGLPAGWGTDHVGEGPCKLHGGASPVGTPGEGNYNFETGIYSDVVRDEDREVLDELEDITTRQKLEETLNLQLMKLRRAVELTSNPDDAPDFWDLFEALVQGVNDSGEVDERKIRELTKLLQAPGDAQRELMDLIRKTAKDLHKMTDGETVRHEHGVNPEQLEEIDGKIDDLF